MGFLTLNDVFSEGPCPAFNVNNLEFIQAVCEAAREEKRPAIVAATEGALAYVGPRTLVAMVRAVSEEKGIRVALHLDHGKSLDAIKIALDAGFSSVMFDGSHLPFDENVRLTAEAARLAHERGATCEGEIGVLRGIEDSASSDRALLTDPDEAYRFVEETGVDALAVAVGTSHGAYKFKGEPSLDLKRLEAIRDKVKIPLVLHGASGVPQDLIAELMAMGIELEGARGVPDDQIAEAIARGVMKVNVDTDLRLAFLAGILRYIRDNPREFDPRKYLGRGRDRVIEVARKRLRLMAGTSD
ncbi:MAG: class II fructose-bisphosphate aldolase [candidate division WOR-3 bacterium]